MSAHTQGFYQNYQETLRKVTNKILAGGDGGPSGVTADGHLLGEDGGLRW